MSSNRTKKKQPGTAADYALPKIGAPATRALAAAGITNLLALAKHAEADIAELHGMGPKALGLLRTALAGAGLSYRK